MKELVFWGATGQAKVLNEAISQTDCQLVALVDNRDIVSPFPGISVLKGVAGLDSWLARRGGAKGLFAVVAVGGTSGCDRLELLNLLKSRGLKPFTVVHRTAYVAIDARLGEGCQVLAMAAVCTHVELGTGVIINTSASVDHDCVVGDGVHIAPGAKLAGEVLVGDGAFVGIGAVVLPRISIGRNAIVGAGAVVVNDVPSGATVIGNPARITLHEI